MSRDRDQGSALVKREPGAAVPSTAWCAGWLSLVVVALASSPALAHDASGAAGGFASGFAHPFGGLDHVVAMVAVGLWGAFLGPPAVWVLPVVFPVVMALGGMLGVAGVPIPSVEIGIALSAVVLGLMVAGAQRPPVWIAALIVGAFAIFRMGPSFPAMRTHSPTAPGSSSRRGCCTWPASRSRSSRGGRWASGSCALAGLRSRRQESCSCCAERFIEAHVARPSMTIGVPSQTSSTTGAKPRRA